jgi:hypothetical protein
MAYLKFPSAKSGGIYFNFAPYALQKYQAIPAWYDKLLLFFVYDSPASCTI